MSSSQWPRRHGLARWACVLTAGVLMAMVPWAAPAGAAGAGGTGDFPPDAAGTVWLCRPGTTPDPCALSMTATVVTSTGKTSVQHQGTSASAAKFDCFYIYPTVSDEAGNNADLKVQTVELDVAFEQASRFSQVCQVWAPMYRQVTLAGLTASSNPIVALMAGTIAYKSILSGFDDYLDHFNNGRPIVFIGHSQGAAMLILLLQHLVDNNASLRHRLVMAIILGGNVAVKDGSLSGGTFSHIPLCSSSGEAGCIIAYSSFPGEPPQKAIFGRPGQGVSLQSGQTASRGLQVACVDPAAIGAKSAVLSSYFPSEGSEPTPWVAYPGLYQASCQSGGGATWLQVQKATGGSDHRPVVTESLGPNWGYHLWDVNLALGDLVNDVAAAEATWSK